MTEQTADNVSEAEATGAPSAEGTESQTNESQSHQAETDAGTQGEVRYQARVDLSSLPPEIRDPVEGRMAHLSSLMKKQETKHQKETRELREIAEQQFQKIAELTNGMGTVVDHLQTKSYDDMEAQLKVQLRQAQQTGDTDAFFNLQDKLTDIRIERRTLEKQQKDQAKQPKQEAQRPNQQNAVTDAVQAAVDNGDITHNDAVYFKAWQTEADQGGSNVRAWASPDDPRFGEAFVETRAVFENKRFANLSFQQKLDEVDRRMGLQKSTGSQTVMGNGQASNLTNGRKGGTLRLTPEQEKIAVRMKAGGSKAKSDADHIARYKQQLQAKGVR